jgi:hypothetical protein
MRMRRTILLPASVGIALVLACAVAILASLASASSATAASIDHGASFATRCNFSHRAQVDPIRVPGSPSGHMHDFFGNNSTDAFSTYQTMTAGGATTTCSRPEDTLGYWIPTVSWKNSRGKLTTLTATRGVFYYRAGLKDYQTVQPFAPDLRDINDQRITWYCGISDNSTGSATPPTRCSGGVLSLKVVFPDCVAKGDLTDPNLQPVPSTSNYRAGALKNEATGEVVDPETGQVIDSPDHESHMVRSALRNNGTTRVCPATHPIPVPTLTVNISFPMPTTSGTVVLASDQPGDLPGASNHVDLWNTWDQDEPLNLNPPDGRSYGGLNALVKHCINEVPPNQTRPLECRAPGATG